MTTTTVTGDRPPRWYRAVTTHRVFTLPAADEAHALEILFGKATPVGIPPAPTPGMELAPVRDDLDAGGYTTDPTPAWQAWYDTYRDRLASERLAVDYGECLRQLAEVGGPALTVGSGGQPPIGLAVHDLVIELDPAHTIPPGQPAGDPFGGWWTPTTRPPDPPRRDWHLHIVLRNPTAGGDAGWAVLSDGMCLGRDGGWSYEPFPSDRSPDWMAAHRYNTLGEAINAARGHLTKVWQDTMLPPKHAERARADGDPEVQAP